jgi:hypothetical protein
VVLKIDAVTAAQLTMFNRKSDARTAKAKAITNTNVSSTGRIFDWHQQTVITVCKRALAIPPIINKQNATP